MSELSIPATRQRALPYLLILPAGVLTALVILWPLQELIQIATHQAGRFGQLHEFSGFENFSSLFNDPEFMPTLWRTVVWTLLVVAGTLVIAIPTAILLNTDFYGRGLARVIIMLPWAASARYRAICMRPPRWREPRPGSSSGGSRCRCSSPS